MPPEARMAAQDAASPTHSTANLWMHQDGINTVPETLKSCASTLVSYTSKAGLHRAGGMMPSMHSSPNSDCQTVGELSSRRLQLHNRASKQVLHPIRHTVLLCLQLGSSATGHTHSQRPCPHAAITKQAHAANTKQILSELPWNAHQGSIVRSPCHVASTQPIHATG